MTGEEERRQYPSCLPSRCYTLTHSRQPAAMKVMILFGLVCVAAAAKLGGLGHDETTTTPEPPKPYNFGFEVRDDETTNYQNRAEVSDPMGRVKGSYSYVLPDGFVYTVTYEDNKDGEGLKAVVKKEPSGIEVIIPTHKPKKAIDQHLI